MSISDWSSDVCSSDLGGKRLNGFNSIFATASIDAAKRYYTEFASQQKDLPPAQRLKIGLIYSFAANEGETDGLLSEEEFETEGLDQGSEEHTSELQSLMRISSAVFCLKKKKQTHRIHKM